MGIKKELLLNEVAGVPKAIKKWSDAFNLTILNILNVPQDKPLNEWDKKTMVVGGVKLKKVPHLGFTISPKAYKQFVYMAFNVKSDEELSGDEDFKKLPLNWPEFKISFTIIPRNRWGSGNPSNVMGEAAFQRSEKARIIDGKIGGVTFTFDLYIKEGTLKSSSLEEQMRAFLGGIHGLIAHELLHAYQYYQETLSKGTGEIPHWQFGKEGVLNWVQQVMGGISESEDWAEFIKLVYYHLSFEINARITQLFYDMQVAGVSNTDEFQEYIKHSRIYQIADELTKFDAEKFVNSFESPYQDFEFERATDLRDILRLGFNPIRNWHEIKLRLNKDKRNKFMLWSLIREWSRIVDSFDINIRQKLYKEGGAEKLDPVPEKAKKDPMVFFKFFEERFHERGEEFKRKIHKLASHYHTKDSLGEKRPGVYGRMARGKNKNNRDYSGLDFDKVVKESDEFDFVRDTEPNIGNYFIPGHVYEIGDKIYRFKEFDPNRQGPMDVHLGTDHYGLVVFEDVTPIDPEFMPFLKNQPVRTAIWTVRTMQQIYDDGLVKDITNINESTDNDFQWAEDVGLLKFPWMIIIPNHDLEKSLEVQKYILNNGWTWVHAGNELIEKGFSVFVSYRRDNKGCDNGQFAYNETKVFSDEDVAEKIGYTKYIESRYGNEKINIYIWDGNKPKMVRPATSINESEEDDFEWTKEISDDPKVFYEGNILLYIDRFTKPGKELKTFCIVDKVFVNANGERSYYILGIDEFGKETGWDNITRGGGPDKSSELKRINLDESEEDDFGWVEDLSMIIKPMELEEGDIFKYNLNPQIWPTDPFWYDEFKDNTYKVVKLDRSPSGRRIIHFIHTDEEGNIVDREVYRYAVGTIFFSERGTILTLLKRATEVPPLKYDGKGFVLESEEDDFQWVKDTEEFDPRGKKIIIDFANDPNWEGHFSFKGKELYQDVCDKLWELGYDVQYLINSKEDVGYIFLEDEQNYDGPYENLWDTGWNFVDSDNSQLRGIHDYQTMTATEFLEYYY